MAFRYFEKAAKAGELLLVQSDHTEVTNARGAIARHEHIAAFDGLRAFAVLAVIAHHINWCTSDGEFPRGRAAAFLASMLSAGWIGVDLFFVLSGFLITGILRRSKGTPAYFRNFYARRTLRIMPLYYGFLFVMLGIVPHFPGNFFHNFAVPIQQVFSLFFYYYNFLLGQWHPYPMNNKLSITPFWTLAVEEQFYIVWPFLIWLLPRKPAMRLCLILSLSSLVFRIVWVSTNAAISPAFQLTPCRLDSLLAGAFIALAAENQATWKTISQYAGRVLIASSFLMLGMLLGLRDLQATRDPRLQPEVHLDASAVLTVGLSALAIGFASLIVILLEAPREGRLRRVLEGKFLRSIGKYSYGMYVFHGFIILMTVHFLTNYSSRLAKVPPTLQKPLIAIWVAIVAYGFAYLSYNIYEKRFLRLKRYFESPPQPTSVISEKEPFAVGG